MDWFELKVFVTEPTKDAISNRLIELGAQGVSEKEESGSLSVSAYFDVALQATLPREFETYLAGLKQHFPTEPVGRVEVHALTSQNWGDSYKAFYTSQKLTNLFFLKPAWDQETVIPEEMIGIVMDPGQAFGTGLHPTTKLSLKILQHCLAEAAEPQKMKIMDVGTGTGILAIGAAKLGVKHVVAIDNDPLAVEAARENCDLNGCPAVEVSGKGLETWPPGFDLIVSNILLETHRELRLEYRRLVSVEGELVLSGILTDQKRELVEFMKEAGFEEQGFESLQEWAAVRFIRRAT